MRECNHPSVITTVRTKKNGIRCVTNQCTTCGNARGELPKSGHNLDALPRFDEVLRDSWLAENMRLVREQWDEEKIKRRTEWFAIYSVYLQTEHWRKVRAIVLARDKTCQYCFASPSQQAHHVSYSSYDKFGVSFAVECVGVCAFCHQHKMHGDQDRMEEFT